MQKWKFIRVGMVLAAGLVSAEAFPHSPPSPDELQQMVADGVYDERFRRVMRSEDYRVRPELGQKALQKIRRAQFEAAGVSPSEIVRRLHGDRMRAYPYSKKPELLTRGEVRTLTVLIDFADHTSTLTREAFHRNIYGNGPANAQQFRPYESVHTYYDRASEGLLDVQGDVLDWHHFANDRATYAPTIPPGTDDETKFRLENQAIFDMLRVALGAVDATTDFAQYDNDHDGDIDLITILYAGPRGGWGTFWWAYRWEFFVNDASSYMFDGKRAKQFVFQFIEERAGTEFNPRTLLHEMGHAVGLPDYYDYDPCVGPDGGVGGLDMMHGNWGNHNAFSRWLVDWIKPMSVGSGRPVEHALVAAGSPTAGNKAIAVFPGLQQSNAPSQEMFILENRLRVGNDGDRAEMPSDGVLIWHVSAEPNVTDDGFEYDNSFTDRKLIRLVRSGNPFNFQDGEEATARDYFREGHEFTSTSTPSSIDYAQRHTHISVTGISTGIEEMKLHVGFDNAQEGPESRGLLQAKAQDSPFEAVSSRARAMAEGAAKAEIDLDSLDEMDLAFSRATPEELATLWAEIQPAADAVYETSESILIAQMLSVHWAHKDGQAALDALLQNGSSAFIKATYPLVLDAWAFNAPQEAYEWYFAPAARAYMESPVLQAPESFTRSIYEWLMLADSEEAYRSLSNLKRVEDLAGAIQGLKQSATVLGVDDAQLSRAIGAEGDLGNVLYVLLNLQDPLTRGLELPPALGNPLLRLELDEYVKQYRGVMEHRH